MEMWGIMVSVNLYFQITSTRDKMFNFVNSSIALNCG